jgi:hypothetical protein
MSAALGLNQAVYAALIDDDLLGDMLSGRKIYSGLADDGAEGRYIVLGTDAETRGGALGYEGYRNEVAINIYDRTPPGVPVSKLGVLTIYGHVRRILSAPLSGDGFTLAVGRLELPLTAVEGDGRTVMAPATFRVQSFKAA